MSSYQRELLTATRLATLRRCLRQHWLRYELGLSRIRKTDALRIGTVFALGLERRNKGDVLEAALAVALAGYEQMPEWAEPYDWAVERETVRALLTGYFWRYQEDNLAAVTAEETFVCPLNNPETGRSSRKFRLAGKTDSTAWRTFNADGRLFDYVLVESKTTKQDIGTGSNYWLRLRGDPQVSMYVLGARYLGHDTHTVIYDVTRKPTIAPHRATPADKRKYTKDGKLYAKQREQDETPEEFGARALKDIGDRPDFYCQRREIVRLEDDLKVFRQEVWDQAKYLLEARKRGWRFRNVSQLTCPFCEFQEPCLAGIPIDADHVPSGFEVLENRHPELEIANVRTPNEPTDNAAQGNAGDSEPK